MLEQKELDGKELEQVNGGNGVDIVIPSIERQIPEEDRDYYLERR